MTKHCSSEKDNSVLIFIHWTRTVNRGKPFRDPLSLPCEGSLIGYRINFPLDKVRVITAENGADNYKLVSKKTN